MNREKDFRDFCSRNNLKDDITEIYVKVSEEFEEITGKNFEDATRKDVDKFVDYLIKNGKNSYDNFVGLIYRSYFLKNNDTLIALYELIDGSEVMNNLKEEIEKDVGKERTNRIFEGIELPPLGMGNNKKPEKTKEIIERLESTFNEEKCIDFLSRGLHKLPKEHFQKERQKYINSKNIDDYLEKKHREFVSVLENHMREDKLFFTQEIDEKVVEFVRNNQMISAGIREGNIIYITKIPYMTKKYLNEKNDKLKRYYYCHCPWAREAIKNSKEDRIPKNFCYCSAGFFKQTWDVVLDHPVKIDVVNSVLTGDKFCKFALHLPENII